MTTFVGAERGRGVHDTSRCELVARPAVLVSPKCALSLSRHEALVRTGFRKLVVQNWHYENAGFLWEACDLAIGNRLDARVLLLEDPMPPFSDEDLAELFPDGFPGWEAEHASIMETSMMMALRPELVQVDRIVDDQAARRPSWDVIPAPREFIPESGVLWRPSIASAELGRRFLDAAGAG